MDPSKESDFLSRHVEITRRCYRAPKQRSSRVMMRCEVTAPLWATNFTMSSSAQFSVLEPVSSSLCSPESHRSHNLKPIFTTHAAKGQADSLSLDVESSKSVLKTSRRSFMTLRCFCCCNWTICCLSTLKMCVKSGEACICHVLNSVLEITVF